MTSKKIKDLTPEELALHKQEAEWNRTLQRLGLGKVDITQVRNEDILYLAKRWQFLQIVESSGTKAEFEKPELIEARSGWTVVNYGNAMSVSPGKFLFGHGSFRASTDDDEGGDGSPRRGTFYKQAFDSVAEMIDLAKALGWAGVLIVDGHPDMQRFAYILAEKADVRLQGYAPNDKVEKMRHRVAAISRQDMFEAPSEKDVPSR